jgi:hypothetical protein
LEISVASEGARCRCWPCQQRSPKQLHPGDGAMQFRHIDRLSRKAETLLALETEQG